MSSKAKALLKKLRNKSIEEKEKNRKETPEPQGIRTVGTMVEDPRRKVLSVPNFSSLFQTYSDYYGQNDYFSKSPVFFKKINEVSIELKSPDEDEKPEFQSIIMTMIPTALMGITTLITTFYTIRNYSRGEGDEETLYTTIVMIIVMFILCFIWPFIERFVDNMRVKRRNKNKVKLYTKYLEQKKEYLEKIMNEQKAALFLNNLSLEECQNVIFNRSSNLFSLFK